MAPVDLARIVEACWHNVETAAAELQLETEATIRADDSRLKQLLENLIRNAVEHGGADVTATIGTCDDGFYVEDDDTCAVSGDCCSSLSTRTSISTY